VLEKWNQLEKFLIILVAKPGFDRDAIVELNEYVRQLEQHKLTT
jgi:hypothetical protein